MEAFRTYPRAVAVMLMLSMLTACAVNRFVYDPYDKVELKAAEDVNPDPAGRPSPLAIKVYELSGRATFDNLDFDAAFSNAGVLLSDELLSAGEYVIQPGELITHRIELRKDAEFVAVVAAYRDIDQAKWKLVYPVNSDWYHSHEVLLNADAVVLGEQERTEATTP